MQIIELLTPAYEAAWLPWAVQYFFLIGICTTTALMVSGCALLGRSGSQAWQLMPVGVTVLLVTAVAAPVSLLADLHQPGRFWHFYAYFTPWSWMSLGAYLLPVFVTLSLTFCGLWYFQRLTLLRVFAVLLALSAISILTYTGMEVMILRSRPLWNTVFLPINFALTGWLGALGAILLAGRWLPGGTAALPARLLHRLSIWATVSLAAGAVLWIIAGLMGLDASFGEMLRLFQTFPVWRLSLILSLVVGAGLMLLLKRGAEHFMKMSLYAALTMLASAWVFRWFIFMEVQGVPKYGAGLYVYSMPWGGDGLLGILGVLGLCAALLAAAAIIFERFPHFFSPLLSATGTSAMKGNAHD